MKHVSTLAAVAIGLVAASAHANDTYRANEVVTLDGEIACYWSRDWMLIQRISGPCDTFTAPDRIAIGETFVANGKTYRINAITATQWGVDYKEFKKGQWTCIAVEDPSKLGNVGALGVQLSIMHCQPIR